MPIDPDTLRTSDMHLAAVDAMRIACEEPEATDVTTDEDLEDRNVRIRRTDGCEIQGVYDKHAEMFAVFVSKAAPGMTNQGAWLGPIDAPWSENLAQA